MSDHVPANIADAIARYVRYGIRPGDFTYAVLCNDLHAAFTRADDISYANLRAIVRYVWREVPVQLWGSVDRVETHIRETARALRSWDMQAEALEATVTRESAPDPDELADEINGKRR